MVVYRYLKKKYVNDPLSADGAKKTGGRWNSLGIPILYTSLSASTAQLEILASVNDSMLLSLFELVSIQLPDDSVWKVEPESLHQLQMIKGSLTSWDDPIHPSYTKEFGDFWFEERSSLALMVPSSLCALDYNVLINTEHPDFNKVQVLPLTSGYPISPRLIERVDSISNT